MFEIAKRIINYLRFDPKKNRSFTFTNASEGFSETDEKNALLEAVKHKLLNKIELTEEEMSLAHKFIKRDNLVQGVYRLDPAYVEDNAYNIASKTVIYDKDTGEIIDIVYEMKSVFLEEKQTNSIILSASMANHYLKKIAETKPQD